MHYVDVLEKYNKFGGRSTRKEYWLFYLTTMAISFGFIFIPKMVGANQETGVLLTSCFILLVLLPWLAVTVRRFHDAGYSAWFLFIPVFSMAILFFDSQRGTNKYGANPKGVEAVKQEQPTTAELATRTIKHIQSVFYVAGAINVFFAIFLREGDNFHFSPSPIDILIGSAILFMGWSLGKSYRRVVPKAAAILSVILLVLNILVHILTKDISFSGFIFPIALWIIGRQSREAITVLENSKVEANL